jgi:hypothetical protein
MFQVLAPVTILVPTEARAALGVQFIPAGNADWREIARPGQEQSPFAHGVVRDHRRLRPQRPPLRGAHRPARPLPRPLIPPSARMRPVLSRKAATRITPRTHSEDRDQ